MKHSYTKEKVIDVVSQSISYAEVLRKLNIVAAGGNYATIKRFIKSHNISTQHFKGQGWNLGKKYPPRPLSEYLSNKKFISSYKLKKRLLNEKILKPICSNCNLTEWLSGPIPLELDHIDGNHFNNDLKNLRLLCPNCHSLTPTFRRSKSSFQT